MLLFVAAKVKAHEIRNKSKSELQNQVRQSITVVAGWQRTREQEGVVDTI